MAVRDKQGISIHIQDSGTENDNGLHHGDTALISSTVVAAHITLPPVMGKTPPGEWQLA